MNVLNSAARPRAWVAGLALVGLLAGLPGCGSSAKDGAVAQSDPDASRKHTEKLKQVQDQMRSQAQAKSSQRRGGPMIPGR